MKITILGDEGVPIQVDGEAWIQPPGVIKIQHKNRAQMLTRDRVRQGERGSVKSSGCLESLGDKINLSKQAEFFGESHAGRWTKLHKSCFT